MFKKDKKIFKLLLGSVSEGVIIVDSNQNIIMTNKSLENLFGYGRKELIGLPLKSLIPQKYHNNHNAHFKGFMGHRESRQMGMGRNLFGTRKDGTDFPLEIGLNPIEIYSETYIMALVIDISERKQHEHEIIELNSRLEEKVTQRTKELKKALNTLKVVNAELKKENIRRINAEEETKIALKNEIELNELKTKFLSLVSHEFKTPLSGILTSTMLLGKYTLEDQQGNRDKHLKTISDKVHYLNNILNDFLSMDKLETGKVNYHFKEFKLSKVVNEVIYNSNMLLKEGQKIKYPDEIDDLSLFQDEKIVELTLSNLVYNAIKYSPENTSIEIIVRRNKLVTVFMIKDEGIGIPKIEQKNIFNRYFRAENAVLTQGTGIGLNIVKGHLENLGGTINFQSEEGKGTVFTVTIPNNAES